MDGPPTDAPCASVHACVHACWRARVLHACVHTCVRAGCACVCVVRVSIRAVPCHMLSCRVVSCRVVSCRVVSCRVVSCRVVSCRVVSCRVVSERVVRACVHRACRACLRACVCVVHVCVRAFGDLGESGLGIKATARITHARHDARHVRTILICTHDMHACMHARTHASAHASTHTRAQAPHACTHDTHALHDTHAAHMHASTIRTHAPHARTHESVPGALVLGLCNGTGADARVLDSAVQSSSVLNEFQLIHMKCADQSLPGQSVELAELPRLAIPATH
jgi:hypothetical protein